MKRAIKTAALIVAALVFSLSPFLAKQAAAANTATMYLLPASGSVVNGSTLAVDVYEDSGGDSVNAARANLNYPAAQLSYVGITSSSAFDIAAASPGGSGSVSINRGATVPVSGARVIATVRFTVLAGSGTAAISFAGGSTVVRSSDNGAETLTTTDGSYTLTSPPSAPPPSSSPPSNTPPSSSTSSNKSSKPPTSTPSSSSPSPTTTADKTVPTISSLNVSDLSTNTATVQWKTSEPATSEVDYGLNTSYGVTAADGKLVTDHKLVLNPKWLAPGKLYHFIIKSADAAGNVATSQDLTFRTNSATSVPAASSPKTNTWFLAAVGAAVLTVGLVFLIRHLRARSARLAEAGSQSFPAPDIPVVNAPSGSIITPNKPSGSAQDPLSSPPASWPPDGSGQSKNSP